MRLFASKYLLIPVLFVLWGLPATGQIVVNASETETITQNGVEIRTHEKEALTGIMTDQYKDGKPKSWISLKNGLADGLWQEWYPNGQLKFNAYWREGKGHGSWEYYHDNGVLRQEEFYNMDLPTGIFRVFYNNGQLKVKSSWLNGKKHGVWTYYNLTGSVEKEETYADNELISTTEK